MPVIPGIMIGSFGTVFVSVQVSVKIPGLRPPVGNPAVWTGTEDAAPPDDPAVAGPAAEPEAELEREARPTTTTDETAADDAMASTTALVAAMRRVRELNMRPVNVRTIKRARDFTFPEQRPSTAPTFG